jgi:hypothetical protein
VTGDEVFYCARIFGRQGTYAEYHLEAAELVAKKPPRLSLEEAASLPLAALTAYDAVITFFQTKPGDTVLIHAGAGGVGVFAVQLAKAAGARVLATGRHENEASAFARLLHGPFKRCVLWGLPRRPALAHGGAIRRQRVARDPENRGARRQVSVFHGWVIRGRRIGCRSRRTY